MKRVKWVLVCSDGSDEGNPRVVAAMWSNSMELELTSQCAELSCLLLYSLLFLFSLQRMATLAV